jgi:ADP-ribose pyrophosphatase YjhB (NUDIX family)
LREAVEREILEQTGITTQVGEPVYISDVINKDESNSFRFRYVILNFMAEYLEGQIQTGDDAHEARWIGPSELKDLHVSKNTMDLLKRLKRIEYV